MTHADRDGSERELNAYLAADKADYPRTWKGDGYARAEAAEAKVAELEAEVERWTEKAQESGAAYANANSKHHAEWDRANRLERLADTLAGKAVELEDRARAAEAKVAALEAENVARLDLASQQMRRAEVAERALRPRLWVCDNCMASVTRRQIADMADGEHVLCKRCMAGPAEPEASETGGGE